MLLTPLTLLILSPAPRQVPTGPELLDRCQAAYDAVRTLRVTVTTKQGDFKAEGHLAYERPGKLRVKGKGIATTFELLVAPNAKWVYSVGWLKQDTAEQAVSSASGVSAQTATYLSAMLLHEPWGNLMKLKQYPITVSTAQLDGKAAYRLDAKGPNTKMSVWLEKSTYFLMRTSKGVFGGQQDLRYGPHKVNQPIPAGTFNPPANP